MTGSRPGLVSTWVAGSIDAACRAGPAGSSLGTTGTAGAAAPAGTDVQERAATRVAATTSFIRDMPRC